MEAWWRTEGSQKLMELLVKMGFPFPRRSGHAYVRPEIRTQHAVLRLGRRELGRRHQLEQQVRRVHVVRSGMRRDRVQNGRVGLFGGGNRHTHSAFGQFVEGQASRRFGGSGCIDGGGIAFQFIPGRAIFCFHFQ